MLYHRRVSYQGHVPLSRIVATTDCKLLIFPQFIHAPGVYSGRVYFICFTIYIISASYTEYIVFTKSQVTLGIMA